MNYKLQIIKVLCCLVLLFIICNLAFGIPPALAHVLKTDGEIGAVVHIDPEDDPIVGEETTIYFDIKDRSGRFQAADCNCVFVVKKAGSEVYSQPLNGTTATYNFPERNVYTLELRGIPYTAGQFQPFTLTYDVRVDRIAESEDSGESDSGNFVRSHLPHIVITVLVLFICGYIVYREKQKSNG